MIKSDILIGEVKLGQVVAGEDLPIVKTQAGQGAGQVLKNIWSHIPDVTIAKGNLFYPAGLQKHDVAVRQLTVGYNQHLDIGKPSNDQININL